MSLLGKFTKAGLLPFALFTALVVNSDALGQQFKSVADKTPDISDARTYAAKNQALVFFVSKGTKDEFGAKGNILTAEDIAAGLKKMYAPYGLSITVMTEKSDNKNTSILALANEAVIGDLDIYNAKDKIPEVLKMFDEQFPGVRQSLEARMERQSPSNVEPQLKRP